MDAKLVKFGMQIPHVILGVLTMWHIQIMLILEAVACSNFNQLFLHDLCPKFGHVSPHGISNVHKNLHKSWPNRTTSNNF
jgi:hypothetical protein